MPEVGQSCSVRRTWKRLLAWGFIQINGWACSIICRIYNNAKRISRKVLWLNRKNDSVYLHCFLDNM
jgi:hypothetical protein